MSALRGVLMIVLDQSASMNSLARPLRLKSKPNVQHDDRGILGQLRR
jgi:hypothetical protein